jgi:hypothetical protein
MSQHAEAAFEIIGWDEETLDETDGSRIYRVKITKTFTGDIDGTSVGWMTMAMMSAESAAYVGFERVEGTLSGRAGSFVLLHDAVSTGSGQNGYWAVVEESGTGDLAGINGAATIVRHDDGRHTLALDYDLPG